MKVSFCFALRYFPGMHQSHRFIRLQNRTRAAIAPAARLALIEVPLLPPPNAKVRTPTSGPKHRFEVRNLVLAHRLRETVALSPRQRHATTCRKAKPARHPSQRRLSLPVARPVLIVGITDPAALLWLQAEFRASARWIRVCKTPLICSSSWACPLFRRRKIVWRPPPPRPRRRTAQRPPPVQLHRVLRVGGCLTR